MCGIAGIVRFDNKPIERSRAQRMLGHIHMRGPDGEGVTEHGRCTLIHARLSIIDIAGGRQPMTRGDLTVTFNGEIYNHHDLRSELESLGHTFQTDHSDTEVLLHGYRQWGSDLPAKLEGMFAFAIWNGETRSLFLARDRMGKKPLYLRRRDREITFASLAATLIQKPIEIDPDAMRMFLRLGYTDGQSLIKDITELPPGHWMMVDSTGRARQHGYWRAPTPKADATAGAVLDAIMQAVAMRLEADVELGCFLSGGIDSSVVAAIAQQQLQKRGQQLKTFSVTMPALDYDESAHALAVARHIGSNHTQLAAQPSADMIDDLSKIIAITGEPTADSSILPTHWLSTATRQHVKVALSGDGGDELFAGYDRYRAMRILQTHRWWLRGIPQMLLQNANPRSKRTQLSRLVDAAHQREPAEQYQSMVHLFTDRQINAMGMTASNKTYAPVPDWPVLSDPLQAARHWDMAYYLPMDLLRKVDRASMAVALEVRCPLLDTRVVELAAALTTDRLVPGNRPKHVLRQIAAALVPSSIVNRPKRGFAIPIGQWFNQSLKAPLADHLFGGRLDAMGFERAAVQRFYDEHTQGRADHTHRLFALLELALWGDWLKGLS
jgi:asparagine synthase (glutamine-hydrolysing)